MNLVERVSRDAFGGVIIRSKLRESSGRQDIEKKMFPSVEVGLPGWQRAHSQGAGLGAESPSAIRYAPAEVNQHFQRLGIERHLRELLSRKPSGVDLWLTTVTYAHPRTLRLKEIQYKVDAVSGQNKRLLFEASIEVANTRDNPRVTVQATPFSMDV